MYPVRLVVVGRLKDSFYQALCQHYTKLLSAYLRLEVVQVKDAPIEHRTRQEIQQEEAIHIRKALDTEPYWVLDEQGQQWTSVALAEQLERYFVRAPRLNLVIGGPLGLSADLIAQATVRWSLSHLTLPHQLARAVVLEQLYRVGTLWQGKRYHY